MGIGWSYVLDFVFLSALLLFSTLLRAKIKIFQRVLMPNALVAGIFGLLLSHQVLGLVPFYHLKDMVYHLLNLTFAFLVLGIPMGKGTYGQAASTGILMSFVFALQLLVGLSLTFVLLYTFMPTLFPAFGALMGIGYASGPGQAFAIGSSWESAGFPHGGDVGLIFGVIGFFWAYGVGVMLLNRGIGKGLSTKIKDMKSVPKEVWSGILPERKQRPVGKLTTSSEVVDTFTVQIALGGLVYMLAYMVAKGVDELISVNAVWGVLFILTVITGFVVRMIIERTGGDKLLSPGVQRHMAGACVDYTVAASVAAISIPVVSEYAVPLVLIALMGGLATLLVFFWLPRKIWRNYRFERTLVCYGTLTGTMDSGIALCRVVDPELSTPAVTDYVRGMPLMFVLVMPLFAIASIPVLGYGLPDSSLYCISAILLLLVCMGVLVGLWKKIGYWGD